MSAMLRFLRCTIHPHQSVKPWWRERGHTSLTPMAARLPTPPTAPTPSLISMTLNISLYASSYWPSVYAVSACRRRWKGL
jgi:hypothetical protein